MRHASPTILICLALTLSGAAHADELSNANQLLVQKKYPEALQLFGKLAKAGNAEAQLRLGEMYWYGEGVALDRAKGDALFAQAAAAGNQEAQAASTLSGKRSARSGDIAYWSAQYDGSDLKTGKFACKAPVIPAVSIRNSDIKDTTEAINTWSTCHNGFANHVAEALPPGKAIPADVLVLMSEQEVEQAKVHLDKVYSRVLAGAKVEADAIMAQRDAWNTATAAYVAKTNEAIAERTRQTKIEMEQSERTRQHSQAAYTSPPPRTK
jgi:TPR repeat protein